MATRTISDLGGNWNATASWVEGVVPTTNDDVVATATSGNLTVNVNTSNVGVNFTNYISTLTVNATLNIASAKNLTLVSGMTINTSSGTPLLTFNGTSTITTNTKLWPFNVTFSGGTGTLNDDFNITGTASITSTTTINSNKIYCGSLTQTSALSGTTEIVLNSTGTWTGSGASLNSNITINTTGTITLGSAITFTTKKITYISGTIVKTGNTLTLAGNCTFDTGTMSWNDILSTTNLNQTTTLNSTFSCNRLFANTNLTFNGGGGFSIGEYVWHTTAVRTTTLQNGNTYNINNWFYTGIAQANNNDGILFNIITSNDGTLTTKLNVAVGATQNVAYLNPTRIDSSGGATVNYFGPSTLTTTTNWSALGSGSGTLPTIAY